MSMLPRSFLLHGGCPDTSDQIDLFLHHLYTLASSRVKGRISLTLYSAAKYNDVQLRKRLQKKIETIFEGNCSVTELLLGEARNESLTPTEQIEGLCTTPHIFLIMNGDTRYAAEVAYQVGMPSLLEQGNKNGVILAGWSCGAIIHSQESISDSNAFRVNEASGEKWDWLIVSKEQKTTFGSLQVVICAHEGQQRPSARPTSNRSSMHKQLVAKQPLGQPIFLLPENMAVQIEDDTVIAIDFTTSQDGTIEVLRNDGANIPMKQILRNGDRYDGSLVIASNWGC